jgi:quinol monooxygenase YgiN
MLYHTVLFKLKENLDSKVTTDFIEALKALNQEIPEIDYLKAGVNFAGRAKGYQIMLASKFANQTALEAYQKHPAHVAFVEKFVKPFVDDIIAGDIEV